MEKYNIPIEMTDDQIFAAKRGNFMDSDEAKMSGENHVSDEQKPFDMTDEQISKAQFGEFLETMKEDFVSSAEKEVEPLDVSKEQILDAQKGRFGGWVDDHSEKKKVEEVKPIDMNDKQVEDAISGNFSISKNTNNVVSGSDAVPSELSDEQIKKAQKGKF
jgi:hypothetical protein